MDPLSLLGLLLAVVAIFGGSLLEGGSLEVLLNGPAALIVFGGTLGAGLLQSPPKDLRRALGMLPWITQPPSIDFQEGVDKIVAWSLQARRSGLLGLERQADLENDDFLRKGLQLLADSGEHNVLREALEVELNVREQRDLQAAKVFEGMGGYAPTIGIIGAVLGLIQVMSNLADPDNLGLGIATAFVATLYGVAIANLVLLPVAGKLRATVFETYHFREMMLEGMLAIAEGHSTVAIRSKLEGYLK